MCGAVGGRLASGDWEDQPRRLTGPEKGCGVPASDCGMLAAFVVLACGGMLVLSGSGSGTFQSISPSERRNSTAVSVGGTAGAAGKPGRHDSQTPRKSRTATTKMVPPSQQACRCSLPCGRECRRRRGASARHQDGRTDARRTWQIKAALARPEGLEQFVDIVHADAAGVPQEIQDAGVCRGVVEMALQRLRDLQHWAGQERVCYLTVQSLHARPLAVACSEPTKSVGQRSEVSQAGATAVGPRNSMHKTRRNAARSGVLKLNDLLTASADRRAQKPAGR